jgi:protocatechuate 3,4-dioxygenase beta subunit
MQRREFLKNSSIVAFGVGTFGSIHWNNHRFIGDTPTTTDILGPYYRPGAPMRKNLNPSDCSGAVFHLFGTVYKEDGKTLYKNCLVEIWQCDENKVYDNTLDDYRYRGTQKPSGDGKYHFITAQPDAYPLFEGSSIYRPAHIHMRISGQEGQQDLITQIYFKGDRYIDNGRFAGKADAASRILNITENTKGEKGVQFDVVMKKEFKPSQDVFDKITGVYTMDDKTSLEFYQDGDSLFFKQNGQIWEAMTYKGDNTFSSAAEFLKAVFDIQKGGVVRVKVSVAPNRLMEQKETEGVRTFKYKS